jgi:hypothetical protein
MTWLRRRKTVRAPDPPRRGDWKPYRNPDDPMADFVARITAIASRLWEPVKPPPPPPRPAAERRAPAERIAPVDDEVPALPPMPSPEAALAMAKASAEQFMARVWIDKQASRYKAACSRGLLR